MRRMVRTYVQRARAEASAATQTRMIEAARDVLVEGEVPRLELSEVAERAGVARSTVYLSFGTRSAFLSRILDDSLSRAGFGRMRELIALPDARQAMEEMLAIRPSPRARISGRTASMRWRGPQKWVAMARSKSRSRIVSTGPTAMTPATLTRTSMEPRATLISASARAT